MGIPCFVIIAPGENDRRFSLQKKSGELVIGRHKKAGLQLQHITVSREHALFNVDTLVIRNRSSKEDTMLVNGKATTETTIKSLDRIQIGVFQMVYFGSDLSDEQRIYNKTSVDKLPSFATKGSQREGATFIMDEEKMQEMQRVTELLKKAHIQSEKDSETSWHLNDRSWTIGKGADIPIGGWFTSSRIAVIEWTGKYHQIVKAGMSAVSISRNNQEVSVDKSGVELQENDQIVVGKYTFSYVMK